MVLQLTLVVTHLKVFDQVSFKVYDIIYNQTWFLVLIYFSEAHKVTLPVKIYGKRQGTKKQKNIKDAFKHVLHKIFFFVEMINLKLAARVTQPQIFVIQLKLSIRPKQKSAAYIFFFINSNISDYISSNIFVF